jgi:sodium-dependent phosphate transporter
MGFALVFGGAKSVVWAERQKDFPFVGGIVPIVISCERERVGAVEVQGTLCSTCLHASWPARHTHTHTHTHTCPCTPNARSHTRTRTGFLSPLLAALVTLVLFLLIRTFVLRRVHSTKIAFWTLPVLLLLTFFINLFFILVRLTWATSMLGCACRQRAVA